MSFVFLIFFLLAGIWILTVNLLLAAGQVIVHIIEANPKLRETLSTALDVNHVSTRTAE